MSRIRHSPADTLTLGFWLSEPQGDKKWLLFNLPGLWDFVTAA